MQGDRVRQTNTGYKKTQSMRAKLEIKKVAS